MHWADRWCPRGNAERNACHGFPQAHVFISGCPALPTRHLLVELMDSAGGHTLAWTKLFLVTVAGQLASGNGRLHAICTHDLIEWARTHAALVASRLAPGRPFARVPRRTNTLPHMNCGGLRRPLAPAAEAWLCPSPGFLHRLPCPAGVLQHRSLRPLGSQRTERSARRHCRASTAPHILAPR